MKEVWHQHNLRVHYKQTDQMGVVHHANYVSWFEIGRTEWMRANGFPYSKMEEMGLLLPVMEVDVKYIKSALYDEVVAIFTKVKAHSPIRLEFYYEARKIGEASVELPSDQNNVKAPFGELLASGRSLHIWLSKNWKPVRITQAAPDIYEIIQNSSKPEN